MTDRQHTVICGDGSIARFSTPERAADYERLVRAGAVVEGLRWLSYAALALAALSAAIKAGVL